MNFHVLEALNSVIKSRGFPCSPHQLNDMLVIRALEELGALEVSASKILEEEGLSRVGYLSLGRTMRSMAEEASEMIDHPSASANAQEN